MKVIFCGYGPRKGTSFSPYATALAPKVSLFATVNLSRGWMLKHNMTEMKQYQSTTYNTRHAAQTCSGQNDSSVD